MKTYSEYLQPQHLRKLKIFGSLTETELQHLVDAPKNSIEDYASKEKIFNQYDFAECMYIILEGSAEVYVRGKFDSREISVAILQAGEYFGENAVLNVEPIRRTASVRAYLPAKVFRIDKQHVLEAIKVHTKVSSRFPPDEVRDMIMSLPMFKSLKHEELLTTRDWAPVVTYKQNKFIFRAGQSAEYMYVILEGNIKLLTLGDDGAIIVVSKHKQGSFFGEIYLTSESRCKYDLFARASIESRIIKIPKEYFRLLMSRDSKLADNLNAICKTRKLRMRRLQTKDEQ